MVRPGSPVTIKAVAMALRRHPIVNAAFFETGRGTGSREQFKSQLMQLHTDRDRGIFVACGKTDEDLA